MPQYLHDGSQDPPKLRVYLNLDNLSGLPAHSQWPGLQGDEALHKLKEDGFDGVQVTDLSPRSGVLPCCGLDRINTPGEIKDTFRRHKDLGDSCITLHLGWGIEDDADVDALVGGVLEASEHFSLPAFIETHRATLTQDMWRTVQLTKRFPGILFNGDFSHYYCGQEMVYGGLDMKLDFMAPIFDRVGFMHGRIASPGHIQAPVDEALDAPPEGYHGLPDYIADFLNIWSRAFQGFRNNAGPGDFLIFAPELLPPTHDYARMIPDNVSGWREESDRYAQALRYKSLVKPLFGC